MALSHLEIVGVVRRRHLHGAGAEVLVDVRVADHRNRTIEQREKAWYQLLFQFTVLVGGGHPPQFIVHAPPP